MWVNTLFRLASEGDSCENYPDSPPLVRGNFCHGQGLARSLLPSAVVRRNFDNDKLSTCIYCTLQLLAVQVVVQKSALDRKTLLLIGIPGPGNAS